MGRDLGFTRGRGAGHHLLGQLGVEQGKRRLLQDALRSNEQRSHAFRRMVLSIPAGKVSTYGAVAAAAGYPRYHRAVAKLLRAAPPDQLPWHRVLGVGGKVKLRGAAAEEQRARLEAEGVHFRGNCVAMAEFEHTMRPWDATL